MTDGALGERIEAINAAPKHIDGAPCVQVERTFISATRGLATGASGVILTAKDGGAHWTRQHSGTTARLCAVTFSNSRHGWAATGAGGTILATSNAGITWKKLKSALLVGCLARGERCAS